jgi:purine-binding chemotaxis protein CheW
MSPPRIGCRGSVPQQFVVFRAAGELYALPLEVVREVVPAAPRRGIPSPPAPWVVGMASIRGELMPVVDLGLRMGYSEPADPKEGVLLVVEAKRRANVKAERAAITVDHVDKLAEPEILTPAPAYAGEAAEAIFERDSDLIMVLKPASLLPDAGTAAPRRPSARKSRPS